MISTNIRRMQLALMRQDVKTSGFLLNKLRHYNLLSSQRIVASGGPVVSLTTHGERLHTVYLTIESMGRGRLLPSKLVLWLDNEQSFNERPSSIRRLEERGLEVRLCGNYGPHTKYYPYLLDTGIFDSPLVIADDDVVYSKWWLAALTHAYRQSPELINCCRAHVIQLRDGRIGPYFTWTHCRSHEPNYRNFSTAVSGCIYPPCFLDTLKSCGDGFLRCCPKADDVWLHATALRAGFKVRQIGHRQFNFPFIPGTQEAGLATANVGLGGNDEQIRATYTADDIRLLLSEGKPRRGEQDANMGLGPVSYRDAPVQRTRT
jgi:hypothetical protein